jgi:hypothetical protein
MPGKNKKPRATARGLEVVETDVLDQIFDQLMSMPVSDHQNL